MNFQEGEFIVNNRPIRTAKEDLVAKYHRGPGNQAHGDTGSNLVSRMLCLCISCASRDSPQYDRHECSDNLRSAEVEYSASHEPGTWGETGILHPLKDSSDSFDSDEKLDDYSASGMETPELAQIQPGRPEGHSLYRKVACFECGQTTFILREILELCVEEEDDVGDLWGDSLTASTCASVSGDEGGANGCMRASDNAASISKTYKPVRWPFRTGFTIWDGCVTLAKFFERCAPTRYPELDVRGRRILELGTGSGVLGNSLAALGATKVVMTDLDYVLPVTLAGVEATWPGRWSRPPQCDVPPFDDRISNVCKLDDDGAPDIDVALFNWKQPRASPVWSRWVEPSIDSDAEPVDMVVAADVIWIEELVPPLVDTLRELRDTLIVEHQKRGASINWLPDIVIAFERRSQKTLDLFLELMKAGGLDWKELEFSDKQFGTNNSDLKVWLFR